MPNDAYQLLCAARKTYESLGKTSWEISKRPGIKSAYPEIWIGPGRFGPELSLSISVEFDVGHAMGWSLSVAYTNETWLVETDASANLDIRGLTHSQTLQMWEDRYAVTMEELTGQMLQAAEDVHNSTDLIEATYTMAEEARAWIAQQETEKVKRQSAASCSTEPLT